MRFIGGVCHLWTLQTNTPELGQYISGFRPKIIEISNNTVLVLQEICGAMIGQSWELFS